MNSARPRGDNDLERLIKLLAMTTSSSDGEAAVAMRKANQLLADKLGGDWGDLLRGKVTVVEDPFRDLAPISERDVRRPGTATPPPASPPPPPQRPPQYHWGGRPQPQTPPPRPASPPPTPPSGKSIRNRFAGPCSQCGGSVDIGVGYAVKPPGSKRWHVECAPCHNLGLA